MRFVLAALVALSLAATGCIIVPARGASRSGLSAKKCPPGHVWSDGACHARGKGHDK